MYSRYSMLHQSEFITFISKSCRFPAQAYLPCVPYNTVITFSSATNVSKAGQFSRMVMWSRTRFVYGSVCALFCVCLRQQNVPEVPNSQTQTRRNCRSWKCFLFQSRCSNSLHPHQFVCRNKLSAKCGIYFVGWFQLLWWRKTRNYSAMVSKNEVLVQNKVFAWQIFAWDHSRCSNT